MLIAIDHGNYAIKTPHTAFLSGISEHKVKPPLAEEVVEYGGSYWTLSGKRLPYMRDKTRDSRFFVLTLFAIGRELEHRGSLVLFEQIDLAVGLPPEHYGMLRDKFAQYFRRGVVKFTYKDQPVHLDIRRVLGLSPGLRRGDSPERAVAEDAPGVYCRHRRLYHRCAASPQWETGLAVLPQPGERRHHYEQRDYRAN